MLCLIEKRSKLGIDKGGEGRSKKKEREEKRRSKFENLEGLFGLLQKKL